MRDVHTVPMREHAELVARVPQVLEPLDLVVPVVEKPLVKPRQPGPLAHQHVRLEDGLAQAAQAGVLAGGGQRLPVGGQIVLVWRGGSKGTWKEMFSLKRAQRLRRMQVTRSVLFSG